MDLSVIVINYKTKELTLQTLASVFKAQPPPNKLEVILVDNGSQDDTPQAVRKKFPRVKLILSPTNLGFAAGNNLGLRQAKGRYLLLLNSDTLVQSDTFVKMVKFMDSSPRVGLATCRVELKNGQLDPASHRGFPTPWAGLTYHLGLEKLFPRSKLFAQYHQGWKDLKTIHEIDSPVGAFYFLRRQALQQVGFLDEAFFMYGEDLDLAYRLKQAGWQVVYTPITRITHLKGASGLRKKQGNKITPEAKKQRLKTTRTFYEAMKIFYRKHYRKKYPFFIRWLVFLGIDLVKVVKLFRIRLL
jgi:GT2 family glycosyltransferase